MKHLFVSLTIKCVVAVLWLGLPGPAVRAQVPVWQQALTVGQAKGAGVKLEAVAADTLGNVYLAGSFAGTVRFGSTTLTAGRNGLTFVAKWNDATQRYCWAVPLAAASVVTLYNLAVSGGTVYAVGSFERPVRLGNSTLTARGGSYFIGKLVDTGGTGRFEWALPVANAAVPKQLVARGTALYVAGDFGGTVRLGPTTLRGTGNRNLFVAKLTDAGSQGRFEWAVQSAGPGVATNPALAVAGARVYVTAHVTDTVTLGPTAVICPPQQGRTLVARLLDAGPSATVSWVQDLGMKEGQANCLIAAGDSLYAAGESDYYVQLRPADGFPTSLQSFFIAKLKDTGAAARLVWNTRFDGTRPTDDVYVMSLAKRGANLYLAGLLYGNGDFGSVQLHATGPTNYFVAQAHETLAGAAFSWVQHLHSEGKVSVASNALALLALASTGRLYLGVTLGPAATVGGRPLLAKPTVGFADYLVQFKLPQ